MSYVFDKLSQYPPVLDDAHPWILEKFVIAMYNKNSTADGVDETRLDLFGSRGPMMPFHQQAHL